MECFCQHVFKNKHTLYSDQYSNTRYTYVNETIKVGEILLTHRYTCNGTR